MNKLLLLPLLLGLASQTAAQRRTVSVPSLPTDSLTHRLLFAGVVAVPGASPPELQARAREWVARTFEDAHQVTQLDDPAGGVLIGRAYTLAWVGQKANGTGGTPQPLSFTFRLEFRPGRYRYEIFDLGLAIFPYGPYDPSLNGAPGIASLQAHDVAAWQLGARATLAASPRQSLLQPDYASNPKNYDLAARYGREWPNFSAAVSQAIAQLVETLRLRETAKPAAW